VCDIREPNLQLGLKIAGEGAKGYKDYREMLDKENCEAVMIAVPLNMHAPVAIAALEAGKHVFCEKQMAYSIEECKQMVRAQRTAGKLLQIGHQRRYNPTYHHALGLIKEGVLGEITHIRALWHRNGSWRRSVPKEQPELERLINWRLYRASSAGLMGELGSHQLDVCNWFLDAMPLSVTGFGGIDYWKDGREVYDNVNCVFEYPNGVKVTYTSITTNQYDDYYEQIMGKNGTLILTHEYDGKLFRERVAEQLVWGKLAHTEKVGDKEAIVLDASATPSKKGVRGTAEELGAAGQKESPYYLELYDFFRCIREGDKAFCDGVVGLHSAVTCLLANEAMEQRKVIEFKPEHFAV
jgi:predicted dehydrogenase